MQQWSHAGGWWRWPGLSSVWSNIAYHLHEISTKEIRRALVNTCKTASEPTTTLSTTKSTNSRQPLSGRCLHTTTSKRKRKSSSGSTNQQRYHRRQDTNQQPSQRNARVRTHPLSWVAASRCRGSHVVKREPRQQRQLRTRVPAATPSSTSNQPKSTGDIASSVCTGSTNTPKQHRVAVVRKMTSKSITNKQLQAHKFRKKDARSGPIRSQHVQQQRQQPPSKRQRRLKRINNNAGGGGGGDGRSHNDRSNNFNDGTNKSKGTTRVTITTPTTTKTTTSETASTAQHQEKQNEPIVQGVNKLRA
jgi:hypothetical protein